MHIRNYKLRQTYPVTLPEDVRTQFSLLQDIVSPNPRRVKRVLNTCAVTYAIARRSPGLEYLHPDLIARLAVLRVQSAALYAAIVRNPELLVALEIMYQGKPVDFAQAFGTKRADSMKAEATVFYGSQEYLQRLFRDSAFADQRVDLPLYLTMLSGAP